MAFLHVEMSCLALILSKNKQATSKSFLNCCHSFAPFMTWINNPMRLFILFLLYAGHDLLATNYPLSPLEHLDRLRTDTNVKISNKHNWLYSCRWNLKYFFQINVFLENGNLFHQLKWKAVCSKVDKIVDTLLLENSFRIYGKIFMILFLQFVLGICSNVVRKHFSISVGGLRV